MIESFNMKTEKLNSIIKEDKSVNYIPFKPDNKFIENFCAPMSFNVILYYTYLLCIININPFDRKTAVGNRKTAVGTSLRKLKIKIKHELKNFEFQTLSIKRE